MCKLPFKDFEKDWKGGKQQSGSAPVPCRCGGERRRCCEETRFGTGVFDSGSKSG